MYPQIAKEWDYENNFGKPDEYSPSSHAKVWWKCSNSLCGCHRWLATINDRTNRYTGCPYCHSKKTCNHHNLSTVYPEIAKEWDCQRNAGGPDIYLPSSHDQVWWVCAKNVCECHRWLATINDRTNKNSGCPYCSERQICPHNNFAFCHPELISEWDYENNNESPEEYSPKSNKNIWWKCSKDQCGCHRWLATINKRINGTGCPYCCNQKTCSHNNFTVQHPKLVKIGIMKEINIDLKNIHLGRVKKFGGYVTIISADVIGGKQQYKEGSMAEHVLIV